MNAKSLSIVVPNPTCVNKCKFCVACMVEEDYKNLIEPEFLAGEDTSIDIYNWVDYRRRMIYARDLKIDTLVFTGNSEPQQNMEFIISVLKLNSDLENPFKKIEIQATGVLLNKEKLYELKKFGLTTISLSLSGFGEINFNYNGTSNNIRFNIPNFCKTIKELNLNLRLSINLTDFFNKWSPDELFYYCKNVLLADQVTFRVLYKSTHNTIQDQWIEAHQIDENLLARIKYHVKINNGLINEMGVIVDSHCMGEKLILRPNCKLYTLWDNKGSLVF